MFPLELQLQFGEVYFISGVLIERSGLSSVVSGFISCRQFNIHFKFKTTHLCLLNSQGMYSVLHFIEIPLTF